MWWSVHRLHQNPQARKLKYFCTPPNWVVSYIAYTKFHSARPVFHSPHQIFTRIGKRASASVPASSAAKENQWRLPSCWSDILRLIRGWCERRQSLCHPHVYTQQSRRLWRQQASLWELHGSDPVGKIRSMVIVRIFFRKHQNQNITIFFGHCTHKHDLIRKLCNGGWYSFLIKSCLGTD